MGGFTKEELDELNLGKNFKYPNTNFIEDKAGNILPTPGPEDQSQIYKFIVGLFLLIGFILLPLFYFRSKGMKIGNLFKSLRDKIHFPKQRISSRTMVMPK
jgi:hypothetical protein